MRQPSRGVDSSSDPRLKTVLRPTAELSNDLRRADRVGPVVLGRSVAKVIRLRRERFSYQMPADGPSRCSWTPRRTSPGRWDFDSLGALIGAEATDARTGRFLGH
jgi:hypothetical protein